MFEVNKRRWLSARHQKEIVSESTTKNQSPNTSIESVVASIASQSSPSAMSAHRDLFFRVITLQNIEKYVFSYEKLNRFQGTIYAKNERLIELTDFLQYIISAPTKLF